MLPLLLLTTLLVSMLAPHPPNSSPTRGGGGWGVNRRPKACPPLSPLTHPVHHPHTHTHTHTHMPPLHTIAPLPSSGTAGIFYHIPHSTTYTFYYIPRTLAPLTPCVSTPPLPTLTLAPWPILLLALLLTLHCSSHTLCVHPAPPHTDPLPRGLSYFSPSCLLCTACSFLLALHPSAFSSAPLLSSPSLPHTRTHTPPTLYSPPTPCPSGTMTSAVPRSSSTEQRARPTPTSPSGAPRQRPEPSRPSAAPPLCL